MTRLCARCSQNIGNLILAALALVMSSTASAYADNGCGAAADRIVNKLGAEIIEVEKSAITLAHPFAPGGFFVGCAVARNDNGPLDIAISSFGNPPENFWRFVGNVSEIVTGASAADVERTARACANRLGEGPAVFIPVDKVNVGCVRPNPAHGEFILTVSPNK
jgi:hypothetical protein